MKVVVVGSTNMDLVISLPRIPKVGETVLGGTSSMVFGGKGANQAVAVKRAGGDVAFITKMGMDLYGDNMKAYFKTEGFPEELLLTDPTKPTGIAQIFVAENGDNSIAVAPGANMTLLPKDLTPFKDQINKADVILAQLETPIETITYLADIASKNNSKFILNPAPAQQLTNALLKKTWLLTPNESEASLLTGIQVVDEASTKEAAAILLHRGVKNVIITLGKQGSLLYNNKGYQHFPAFNINAIDTTAAGDVFNGALVAAIINNTALEEAICYASAAAAISVTRNGAQPSIPYLVEIEQFLNKNTLQ